MTCREMDAALFAGGELPRPARDHMAQCANCRALAATLRGDAFYAVDAATLDRAHSQIPEALAPVRPLAPAGAYAALFAVIAAGVAAVAAARIGLRGLPLLTPVQGAAVFGVLLALLLLAAFAVARAMRPGARTVRGMVVFGVAFAATEAVFLMLFHDYSMGRFVHSGLACFRTGLACAAAAALLVWLAMRRGYVVAPVSTGAAIGALAGLAGLTALELHCPLLNVPHLAVWHAGVLAASAATGAAAGWAARMKPA
jgi:hypothetical protein